MALKQSVKRSSLKTRAYEEIRRQWGDVDVVDAEQDLRVFVEPQDVKAATAKDPGCCVFAQACKRQFSASKVCFWKSVAYVELPGPDGKRRVERFTMSPDMRRLVENFDKGKPVANLAGFVLKRPKPSSTFEGKLAINRASRERTKKAMAKGRRVPQRGRRAKKGIAVDLQVRDGKGRVHFQTA